MTLICNIVLHLACLDPVDAKLSEAAGKPWLHIDQQGQSHHPKTTNFAVATTWTKAAAETKGQRVFFEIWKSKMRAFTECPFGLDLWFVVGHVVPDWIQLASWQSLPWLQPTWVSDDFRNGNNIYTGKLSWWVSRNLFKHTVSCMDWLQTLVKFIHVCLHDFM